MPEKYELQLERHARRSLDRLPARDYERISAVIDSLTDDPRPRGALKLSGMGGLMRLRAGNYRIIYSVFDRDSLVKVLDVERRTSQTYERL